MAREYFVEGVQFTETGEEEYFIEGVQVNEDQPTVVPSALYNGPINFNIFKTNIICSIASNILETNIIEGSVN